MSQQTLPLTGATRSQQLNFRPLRAGTSFGGRLRALVLAMLLGAIGTSGVTDAVAQERAFPGAEGWAATTPGGRGGKILRVMTLAASGSGSFPEALEAKGPRIVVFEVGGVIDLNRQKLKVTEPFLTIAGQTAPAPGITFIRGGITIETHDVVIQHIRVRPGRAGFPLGPNAPKWEVDAMSTWGSARDVIVDHCSFSWASDENLSAAGLGFVGKTPEEWRQNGAQRITYSNNIIAESIENPLGDKVSHGKGTLVLDNVTNVLIVGNLYASNPSRNPLIKGGVWTAVVNNLIYNPVTSAVDYHLPAHLFKDRLDVVGRIEMVGNVLRHGPNTKGDLPLLGVRGEGDLELHVHDNLAVDRKGQPVPHVRAAPEFQRKIIEKAAGFQWPAGLRALPAREVEEHVLQQAGARPWDRDEIDRRIVEGVRTKSGRVIKSEQEVGGYPKTAETRQAFNPEEWDLSTMVRRSSPPTK